MFFFSLLTACSPFEQKDNNYQEDTAYQNDTAEYMCDAICVEIDSYTFTKALDSYVVNISFTSSNNEIEGSLNAVYSGTDTEAYEPNLGVELNLTAEGLYMNTEAGFRSENIIIEINGETVNNTLTNSEESFVCGSTCLHNSWEMQTDLIENLEPNITTVNDLNYAMSCATTPENTLGDLTIVARNEAHTTALIIHEIYGYDPSGGAEWNNGFNNSNLSVELHQGIDVGVNYCTDAFVNEEITERYIPIDFSELPSNIDNDLIIEFTYGVDFPLCEDCSAITELYVENFWFRSAQGNYVKIGLVDHLQSQVLLNYGG